MISIFFVLNPMLKVPYEYDQRWQRYCRMPPTIGLQDMVAWGHEWRAHWRAETALWLKPSTWWVTKFKVSSASIGLYICGTKVTPESAAQHTRIEFSHHVYGPLSQLLLRVYNNKAYGGWGGHNNIRGYTSLQNTYLHCMHFLICERAYEGSMYHTKKNYNDCGGSALSTFLVNSCFFYGRQSHSYHMSWRFQAATP